MHHGYHFCIRLLTYTWEEVCFWKEAQVDGSDLVKVKASNNNNPGVFCSLGLYRTRGCSVCLHPPPQAAVAAWLQFLGHNRVGTLIPSVFSPPIPTHAHINYPTLEKAIRYLQKGKPLPFSCVRWFGLSFKHGSHPICHLIFPQRLSVKVCTDSARMKGELQDSQHRTLL